MGINLILTAQTRLDKAKIALESGDRNTAWELCHQVCQDLMRESGLMRENAADEGRALFISACLNLSQLGFILGMKRATLYNRMKKLGL